MAGPRVLLALTVAGLPRMAWSVTPWCATVGKGYVDTTTVPTINGGFLADAAACQQTCSWDPTCAFFTYYPKTFGCWKYPQSAANKSTAIEVAVSGPKTCSTSSTTLDTTTPTTTPPATTTVATTEAAKDIVNATEADQGELGVAPVEIPAASGGLPDGKVMKKGAAADRVSQMHWWGWVLIALAAIALTAVGYHFLCAGGPKGSKRDRKTRSLRSGRSALQEADVELEAEQTVDSMAPLVAEAAPLPTSFAPVPTYNPVPGLTPPNLAAALGPPPVLPPLMPQPMMQAQQVFDMPAQRMVQPGLVPMPMPQARRY